MKIHKFTHWKRHGIKFKDAPLPWLLSRITGRNRSKVVDLKWGKFWTYNAFRLWELVFWRRDGKSGNIGDTIRPEMASIQEVIGDEVTVRYYFYTIESFVVHCEGMIRAFFKLPKFSFRFVKVPQLATPTGMNIPLYPPIFSLAIAFDAAVGYFDNSGTTTTFTQSHTVTGSNPILVSHPNWDATGGQTISSVTYAGAAMTHAGTDVAQGNDKDSVYIKMAPATGANNFVVTVSANLTASKQMRFPLLSYSGAAQTGQPDSIAGTNGSGNSTQTGTTTVVAANCWLVGYARNDSEVCAAGTGTTSRCIASTGRGSDSNGTVATGSRSLQWTTSVGVSWCGHVESIAPATISNLDVSVSDSISITESVTMLMTSFINVNDAISITESVTMLMTSFINVNDAISITESVSINVFFDGYNVSVSDSISITESVSMSNPQLGDIGVNDSITITESVSLARVGPPDLSVSVSDALSITENVNVTLVNMVSVSDSVSITESVTMFTPDRLSGIAVMRGNDDNWPLGMDDLTIL